MSYLKSFFIAGANSPNVSLWSVSDESTTEYMTELYKLIKENNLDYFEINCEIKRKFIKGKIMNN